MDGIFYGIKRDYDIGSTISLLILNDQEREIFLNGYYGRERTPKEEALICLGEVYALVHNSLCAISIIRNLKQNLDDQFYESITEWSGLRTGKARIEKGEFGNDIGNVKIGVLMYKQAELYINSPKFQNLMKNLDI